MNPGFPAGFHHVTYISPCGDRGHRGRKGFVKARITGTFAGLRSKQEQYTRATPADGTLRERIP